MPSRKSVSTDLLCLEYIEKMTEVGGFKPGEGANRLVSSIRGGPVLEQLAFEQGELEYGDYHASDRIKQQLQDWESHPPKEWRYTSHLLRDLTMFHACRPGHARKLTCWIGETLKKRAREENRILAKWLRKRISDRLRRLMGAGEYEFWFSLEATRKDREAIHAHGILHLRNPEWWTNKKLYRQLRDNIRIAAGTDPKIDNSRQLDTSSAAINHHWISYCRKQRRSRWKTVQDRSLPASWVGEPLNAGTRNFRQRTKRVYESARYDFRRNVKERLRHYKM